MDLLMRRMILSVLLGLVSAAAVAVYAQRDGEDGGPMRVLFVGNSYTGANRLTQMIARLSVADGGEGARVIVTEQITPGGATLAKHLTDGKAAARIAAGRFDVVVLQEQSTTPVLARASMHEAVRELDAAIDAAGARTVLYMTWARQANPAMLAPLAEAYETIGAEVGAAVAPVGRAWEAALALDDPPALYNQDGSHPSPAGSYLAACVLFETITGRDCTKLGEHAIPGVDAALAARLRTIAHETVAAAKDR